jgi:hypothetical protein
MPRICTICTHPERAAIDAAIAAGEPNRRIAPRYQLEETAIRRHKVSHLAEKLTKAMERRDIAEGDSLLDRLHQVTVETQTVLAEARAAKDHELVLRCIARLEKQIELEARLLGELKEQVQSGPVSITVQYIDRALIARPERVIE